MVELWVDIFPGAVKNTHPNASQVKLRPGDKLPVPGIVLTFPILSGNIEAWRRFCQELSGSRLRLYEASRRRLGVTCERMALLETPFGSAATTTLEAADIGQVLAQLIVSNLPFDRWYRERVEDLHGISLAGYEKFAQPEEPLQPRELLFEWSLPAPLPDPPST